MSQHPLADFLEVLERSGELQRITVTVDPVLEIAQITSRVAQAGGPALLFEQVRGARLPVVTNLLGKSNRACLALGLHDVPELVGRVTESLEADRSEGWLGRLRRTSSLGSAGQAEPSKVKSARCQQVVRIGTDVDLHALPVLTCWPQEARPAITANRVYSGRAGTPCHCLGTHRLEVVAKNKLAIHWLDHEAIAGTFRDYQQQSEQMPVSIVLGGHPKDLVLAGLSNMTSADPRLLHAVRACEPVQVVQGKTIQLNVPADADVVLEGRIDAEAPPVEMGPSGGLHGHYLLPRAARVIEITAITERVNPIISAVVPSGPPCEQTALTEVLSHITLPLLQLRIPEVVDYHLSSGSRAGGVVFVAIRKAYAGGAQKVAAALWGSDEFFLTKLIVLVDEDVDIRDHARVMLAVGANVDPAADVHFHAACGQASDHALWDAARTQRMAIDATTKLPAEHRPAWPAPLVMSEEIDQLVEGRWDEYGWQDPSNRE